MFCYPERFVSLFNIGKYECFVAMNVLLLFVQYR